ncbi:hypothetical protein MTO96_005975 [Rhipicephalus appendiculatus]
MGRPVQWLAFRAASEEDHLRHPCSEFYIGPTPEDPCVYSCYATAGVFKGVLTNGVRCRPPPPTDPPPEYVLKEERKMPRCRRFFGGIGYAPSCHYRCVNMQGQLVLRLFRAGIPCLNLNHRRLPVGAAGVCQAGRCLEYDHVDVRSRWAAETVFRDQFHQCPPRKHLAKRPLLDCHHYCWKNNGWYFGVYLDGSRCLDLNTRKLGWCCHGLCLSTPCKQNK